MRCERVGVDVFFSFFFFFINETFSSRNACVDKCSVNFSFHEVLIATIPRVARERHEDFSSYEVTVRGDGRSIT